MRLFRLIEGEVRIAAEARNTAAVQFHFGNREGLLQALIERHMPGIAAIQQELYDEAVAAGRQEDPRSLVEILVRPAAEYLTRGASERAWVKIMADLGQLPDLKLREMVAVAPPEAIKAGTAACPKLRSGQCSITSNSSGSQLQLATLASQ